MKFIFKTVVFLIIFFISLIYFLPKENLYYFAEKQIQKEKIVISNEVLKESFLNLEIKNAQIYFDGINTAFVKDIDFISLFFYTNIEANNLKLSNSFKKFDPSKIESININHSILDFNKIYVKGKGDFGEFIGEVKILDRKIVGQLKPSNIMKSKYRKLFRQFKFKDGKYNYEFSF